MKLFLVVTYPPSYPDVIPELALEEIEADEDDEDEDGEDFGELRDGEADEVIKQLNSVVGTT